LKYWKVTHTNQQVPQLVLQKIRIENGIEKWRSIIGNIKIRNSVSLLKQLLWLENTK
jgi:hypothetical protein